MLQELSGSSTVTVALQVVESPLLSVTVSITVFSPMLAQLKVVISIDTNAISQLSVLPPSRSPAEMVAWPLISRSTVIS